MTSELKPGEFRNLALFSNRLVKVYQDLIIMPEEAATKSADGNSEKPKAKAKK